jgi:hypothetical protein
LSQGVEGIIHEAIRLKPLFYQALFESVPPLRSLDEPINDGSIRLCGITWRFMWQTSHPFSLVELGTSGWQIAQ